MKISKKLRAAFKRYYENRKRAWDKEDDFTWDKEDDIKNIEAALLKGCGFSASAGTFWITWQRSRTQTVHSEKNYWTGKVRARKVKGEWKINDKVWA